ncbi:hypothetical protein QLX08_009373 [Tetragonisca angustula]|uniref:Uncharacterized protein n=1 Tax=Tetragonisca angustula TaxID=166442 RepID=A0AAW0ZH21_9HYME
MQHEPIVLGCNCCYTRGTASYVFGAADVPETKGWTSTTTEIGPLNRLYMPGASYNDTCPVFLRLNQSIPPQKHLFISLLHCPKELPHRCDDVCPGPSSDAAAGNAP